ncbi:peptidase family C78-domain-containing protein [Dichotomocladium elegans]|nr:peptidase family C78-domain-containing protein [Dichotomocladium elegans]
MADSYSHSEASCTANTNSIEKSSRQSGSCSNEHAVVVDLTRRQMIDKEGSVSPLKRKEEDDYASDLYQLDTKRIQTENRHKYARETINADSELWETLTALSEESRTAGVIPRLGPQFRNLSRKGTTAAAYLCSPYTDHIGTGIMDLGWGCGYRNCQMLMTFLQRKQEAGDYLLRQVADIGGLQLLLERAWREGFDQQGAKQLDHHVYKTHKWIGTTEVYCMLVYLGIRCTILDFHRPSGPNNQHDGMFDWIQSYFESGALDSTSSISSSSSHTSSTQCPTPKQNEEEIVHITDRPPLYLQHSGHSRTVIGIELLKDGKRNLIMFDPGRRMLRSYRSSITGPDDDTAVSSANSDADSVDESQKPHQESQRSFSRLLSTWKPRGGLPANLLRPFRVDAKAIAKNNQYQVLALGEVQDLRASGGGLFWNGDKGFLLDEIEREAMKNVTSVEAQR